VCTPHHWKGAYCKEKLSKIQKKKKKKKHIYNVVEEKRERKGRWVGGEWGRRDG